MIVREGVSLSSLTTFRVGGPVRYTIECSTVEEVTDAVAFAKEQGLPWRVLGEGSNVLASDEGFEGVLLLMRIPGVEQVVHGGMLTVTAGSGVSWDALVHVACSKGAWGLENLAGIPGTVGAAPVQNIGAYGAEVKDTLSEVHVLDAQTGEQKTFSNKECDFAYRSSRFKREPWLVILSVSFKLPLNGVPSLTYKDFSVAKATGQDLSTPASIATVVRSIRANKFPDLATHGTAGSFFKNPTISAEAFARLQEQYPELPGFPTADGIKIPIAYILDHVLHTRGYKEGAVGFFENHSLILVAEKNATENELNTFAKKFEARIKEVSNIDIEREVQTFP